VNYDDFINGKHIQAEKVGFTVSDSELNPMLKDFQKHLVKKACEHGVYALFEDCGLGKTFQQLEWARLVADRTQKPVLILCPLAVSAQTIEQGEKFGIGVSRFDATSKSHMIHIANYEQVENIDTDQYSGVVLDESSILKNYTGKMRNLLTSVFKKTPYKLCCTATPAPNDPNEIGQHSEFLTILDSTDMRSRWFVREEGMSNYRLKGHAVRDFYGWVSSWATMISNPADIGFDGEGYNLPKLSIIDHKLETDLKEGAIVNGGVVSATTFNSELKRTVKERMGKAAEIANATKEQVIVWVNQDIEEEEFCKLCPDAVPVRGSMKPEEKEKRLLGFAHNDFRVLVTKKKIAQFGLNYQNCHIQIFATVDFSFEGMYQAIRRSYRFGQTNEVQIHMILTDTMQNISESISRKEGEFETMRREMYQVENEIEHKLKRGYNVKQHIKEQYTIVNGDSCEEIKNLPDNSVDFSVFSPPFSNIFTYSDHIRDMGNCETNEEFFTHTDFLLKELYRVIKDGRLVAVHTKDIPKYKGSSGYTGMYDFTGDYHRAMEKAGFKYFCKICIWTDPVLERARTNTQRLLYKQVTSDSSFSGVGMPEYVTVFKKWEGNEEDWVPVSNKTKENYPLSAWQKWASPVWMDISRTDVLNGSEGTAMGDEKHICPLQLGVIERCVQMWSNPGEVVFSPFAGIGSEGFESIKAGRKFYGIELKESYYETAIKNLDNAIDISGQMDMFSILGV